MGSEQFLRYYAFYEVRGPPEYDQFGPQGHDLCRRPLNIAIYTKYTCVRCWSHGFREYFFFSINDHWAVAKKDPMGKVGWIYVGNHLTSLHTGFISCGPHGFRRFFNVFPIISLWKLMTPVHGQFGSQGHGCQDL